MRRRIVFSPEAETQLLDIFQYIAEAASPETAERFTASVVDFCEALQLFPERGTRRDDLRPGLRTVGFKRSVTIAFFVGAETVTIIGVFYGGQDVEAVLSRED